MLLTPIGQPLPQHLLERGYRILGILEELPLDDQLNLACRTVLAALVTFRTEASEGMVQWDDFKAACDGVQVWLKDEIIELQRPPR